MAASASKSTTLTSNTGYSATLTASFDENSTSTSGNTSNITVTATQKSGNFDWSSSYNSSLQIYWYDNNANSAGKLVATKSVTSQGRNVTITASGTITVSHKSDGTLSGYARAVWTKAGNSNWTPNSGSVQTSDTALTRIPRAASITAAPNFNDTENPTITYSNAAGNSVASLQACIANTAGTVVYVPYRDISKTGSSYTFELTAAERNALRQACANSKTLAVKFYVTTVIGGSTYYSTLDRTMTIVNGNPTFYMNYKDTNATVVAVTGNNQQIVRNQSTLQINITDAVAVKYATLVSATCVLNGVSYSGTFSGDSCTFNIGTINVSSNTTATLTVTDSRGLSTTKDLSITVLDWQLPSAIITMQRHDNFYSNTDIKVDGSISSVNNLNTMTIKLRYKKTSNSTWSSYTTMQDNVAQTFNLDNNFAWDVQVVISDRFGSTTYNLVLSRGMPIIYFDRQSSSVGVNCFPIDEKSLEVNGVPVNRNIMTYGLTNNVTSPTVNNYTKVPLNNPVIVGDRLTASSNGVKIGKGVSKVLVSAQMMVVANTKAGICYIRIAKNNGADVLAWCIQTAPAGGRTTLSIAPTVVDVAENDVINMYYYVPANDDHIYGSQISSATTGSLTWMTVDVVG